MTPASPVDPVRSIAAAAMMGMLLARGLASERELLDAVEAEATALTPASGRTGIRSRLARTLHAAAAAAQQERAETLHAVARITAALAALWATYPQFEESAPWAPAEVFGARPVAARSGAARRGEARDETPAQPGTGRGRR